MENKVERYFPREYAMAEMMAMKCGWKRQNAPWESQVNLHYQKLIKDQRMYAAYGMRVEVIA